MSTSQANENGISPQDHAAPHQPTQRRDFLRQAFMLSLTGSTAIGMLGVARAAMGQEIQRGRPTTMALGEEGNPPINPPVTPRP
ncbi:MAG: hypothetical protein WBD31_00370, partial [Rubripirellula sp.]